MGTEKILRNVPKAYYGAYGGITPFPICLKCVTDYLGDEADYSYAIVACGGAFRLTWDTTSLNGGNVDISHTFNDSETVYRNGITAFGREFKMLWREGNNMGKPGNGAKDDFKAFIIEQIDAGNPLISLGPIGPPEAGVITGYADGGESLVGWSVFQWDVKTYGDEGYYITDKWWEASDFFGVMSIGGVVAPRKSVKQIVRDAIVALEGRMHGIYAKGVAAYEPWKSALINASENDLTIIPDWGQSIAMMCQGDATDCLIDGRKNACIYFRNLSIENPGQKLYADIAEQFGVVATIINSKIYKIFGGYERGPEQEKQLAKPDVRREIGVYIDEMKAADEKALALMKTLLTEI